MGYHSPYAYRRDVLDPLLQSSRPGELVVHFITEKHLEGHAIGTTCREIGRSGRILRLIVSTGGIDDMSNFGAVMAVTIGEMRGDCDLSDRGYAVLRDEAQDGQRIAFEAANVGTHPDLIVVYAGLSSWQTVIDQVRALHAAHPDAAIDVLTCDCELKFEKRPVLTTLLSEKIVTNVIVTYQCGGHDIMIEFIDATIAAYNEPAST